MSSKLWPIIKSSAYFYFAVGISAYLFPYLFNWNTVGLDDADSAIFWSQIAIWWHQWGDFTASWNPYINGGYPLFGNPQLPVFHAALPLFVLFGPVAGLKLMILIWASAGFWLAYALCRDLEFTQKESGIFGCCWILNGVFVAHMGQTHAHFVCFFLVPGFYLFIRRWILKERITSLVFLTLLTLISAVASYGFFAYFLISIPSYFAFEVWFRKLPIRKILRLSIPFVITFILSLLMMSFYLLPVFNYFKGTPRLVVSEFENPLKLLAYLVVIKPKFASRYGPWEYQSFIGPVLSFYLVLALIRVKKLPLDYRAIVGCGFMHYMLSIGSFYSVNIWFPSPFDILRGLIPTFTNVRVVSRFFIGAVPTVLFLAFWQWKKRGIRGWLVFFVLGPLVAFQIATLVRATSAEGTYSSKPKPSPYLSSPFEWIEEQVSGQMYGNLQFNSGIAHGYDPTPLPGKEIKDLAGPLVTELPRSMHWKWLGWGKVHFSGHVKTEKKSYARIKMNYHPGWSISSQIGESPTIIPDDRGGLIVKLPSGPLEFDVIFKDPSLILGAKISLLGLFAYILFVFGWGLLKSRPHSSNGVA